MGVRHEMYWRGYRMGRRTDPGPLVDHERQLRAELNTATNEKHRAWALGELRGYRDRTRRV